jgi:hypothetical protein
MTFIFQNLEKNLHEEKEKATPSVSSFAQGLAEMFNLRFILSIYSGNIISRILSGHQPLR